MKPLYQVLAHNIAWQPPVGTEWVEKRAEEIKWLLDKLPSGSGWDSGTKLMKTVRTHDQADISHFTLYGSFHHMDEGGSYDGWTDHQIIVTADLRSGFTLRITGRNRNDIKDYLHELFDYVLREQIHEYKALEEAEWKEKGVTNA